MNNKQQTMNANQSLALNFDYENKHYEGEAIPASSKQSFLTNPAFDIFIDDEYNGTIVKTDDRWTSDNHFDSDLVAAIGSIILAVLITM
jgi:hypothetical protein